MAVILTGSEYIDLDAHGAALNIPQRPLSWYAEFSSTTSSAIMFLVSHGRNPGAGTQEYAFLWINSGLARSRWNGAVQGQIEVTGSDTADGNLHRLCTVVRASADSMAQFLDGSPDVSTGSIGAQLDTANINDTTAIGRDAGADQFYFIGQVSNVAVWNVELSTADAQDLTAGTITPLDLPTGLLGYWPLDYDARDESGNGLHGTPVGDPDFTEEPPGGVTADITHGLVLGHVAIAEATSTATVAHGLVLGHQATADVSTPVAVEGTITHGLMLGHQVSASITIDVDATITHGLVLGHAVRAQVGDVAVTPPERTLVVAAETRAFIVPAETRRLIVA